MDTIHYINILPNQNNWDLFYKVIFPILTLLLGAFISFGFQWILEIRRIRLINKYLVHSLIDLNRAIDSQIIHYDTFISKIKENTDDLPVLFIEPGFHVLNLETISRYDTFKSIVLKGFRNKEYKREVLIFYNNSTEIIKVIEGQTKEGIDSLKKSEYQDKISFNTYFFELQNLINKRIKNYKERKAKDSVTFAPLILVDENSINKENELVESVLYINEDFLKIHSDSKTIFQYEEKFINPIFEIAKKHEDLELISYILPIISLLNKIKNTRILYIHRLDSYKQQLLIAKDKFNKLIEL
jgi:hypothetical protein